MKIYRDELKTELKDYHSRIYSTKLSYGVAIALSSLVDHTKISGPYVSLNGGSLYITLHNPEFTELELIPAISDMFDTKWSKYVVDTGFNYSTSFNIKTGLKECYLMSIHILLNLSDSCEIKKVPTGKTVQVSKYVDVTELEYDTVISCAGD